jgi:hypothetical protein
VDEDVSKSDDAPVLANTLCGGRVTPCELSQGLAYYLKLALYGGAEHRVVYIIRERLAGRELCVQLGGLRNVIQISGRLTPQKAPP